MKSITVRDFGTVYPRSAKTTVLYNGWDFNHVRNTKHIVVDYGLFATYVKAKETAPILSPYFTPPRIPWAIIVSIILLWKYFRNAELMFQRGRGLL